MCGSFTELALWSEAWVHARRAMEALAPPGEQAKQQDWAESRLNELDEAEAKEYQRTSFGPPVHQFSKMERSKDTKRC